MIVVDCCCERGRWDGEDGKLSERYDVYERGVVGFGDLAFLGSISILMCMYVNYHVILGIIERACVGWNSWHAYNSLFW